MRRSTMSVGLLAAGAIAIAGCGSSNSAGGNAGGGNSGGGDSSGPVKIGILIPQSGDAAATGQFMTAGAKAAIDQINAAGGVAGRKIQYKVYDTVGDPQSGINAYNQFVSDGERFGITGFSDVVTAIGPIAAKQNVLLVNSGAPPFNATAMGSHTIHTLNGEPHEMTCAAQYAYKNVGARRVAAIYADIAANRAGVQTFANQFQQLGGKVVDTESEPQGSSNFQSILARVKGTNPNLVFLYTYGSDPGNIEKQMKELGINAKILGYSGAAVPQTVQVAGAAANGSMYTAGLYNPNSSMGQTFLKWYKTVDPSFPSNEIGFYNATLYDGTEMLAKAMEYVKAHGGNMTDPTAVQDAFYKIGTFQAVTGTAKFTPGNPIPSKPFQVLQVQNGKFVPIGTVNC